MNGADYLAFFDQFDPSGAALGRKTTDWMLEKAGKTYGKTGYPSWYGPGVRLRDAGRGIEIWHTGSWRRQLPPDNQGPALGRHEYIRDPHGGWDLVVRSCHAACSRRGSR